jgi:hypothetical protein
MNPISDLNPVAVNISKIIEDGMNDLFVSVAVKIENKTFVIPIDYKYYGLILYFLNGFNKKSFLTNIYELHFNMLKLNKTYIKKIIILRI